MPEVEKNRFFENKSETIFFAFGTLLKQDTKEFGKEGLMNEGNPVLQHLRCRDRDVEHDGIFQTVPKCDQRRAERKYKNRDDNERAGHES